MAAEKLFKLFKNNQMKENTDRFHLILRTGESNQIQTGNSLIKVILCEKLIRVKFDHKLVFDQNVKIFYKKAKAKLKALARVVPYIPAGIYLLKVNNRNTRTRCEICSKLTINTPERRHWRRSGVFIVNFEHISYLVLVFLLLTLNK